MRIPTFAKHLALLILIVGSAPASADWSSLLFWVNKYPSEKGGPDHATLLDQPMIKTTLRSLVPKAERASLNRFDVESTVRQIGDYIIIDKCLPHNCPADLAMIVIDVKNQKVWAGFFTREDKRVSTRWYGNADDYSVLPEEIRKEFLARHGG